MTEPAGPSVGATGKFAILGIGILPALALGAIAVMLPAIADAFGRGPNDIQIKMVSTAVGFGTLMGAPLGGLLADRIGRRLTLMIATAIFGVLGCSIMLMNDLWAVIGARFIIGLATGMLGVGVAAVIGDLFTGNRQSRWIGYAGGLPAGLTLILIPLTGVLTDYSWRLGFSLYVLAVPIFLAVMFGLPKMAPAAKNKGADGELFLPLNKLPVNALLLAGILGTLATGTSLYWPFRLREVGITKAADIAIHALPQVLCITLFALLYGRIRKGLSVQAVFLVSALLSAVGLGMIAFAPNHLWIIAGLAVEGVGIGMMMPNVTTYALAISPMEYRGRILGVVKGVVYGSPFLTQFMLYPLSQIGGSVMALVGICGMSLLLALGVSRGWIGRTPDQAPVLA